MKTDELKIQSDSYSEKAGKPGVCGGKEWEIEGVPVTDGKNVDTQRMWWTDMCKLRLIRKKSHEDETDGLKQEVDSRDWQELCITKSSLCYWWREGAVSDAELGTFVANTLYWVTGVYLMYVHCFQPMKRLKYKGGMTDFGSFNNVREFCRSHLLFLTVVIQERSHKRL